VAFLGLVSYATVGAEAKLQRLNEFMAIATAIAQLAATGKAVLGAQIGPQGIWSSSGCPALGAKLEGSYLRYCQSFRNGIEILYRNCQGIGQAIPGFLVELAGDPPLQFADTLGMNPGLTG